MISLLRIKNFNYPEKIYLTDAKAYAMLNTMTDQEIIAKIETYMSKNNLRQYELAKQIGVPESTVNRWLKRKTTISNAYRTVLKTKGII